MYRRIRGSEQWQQLRSQDSSAQPGWTPPSSPQAVDACIDPEEKYMPSTPSRESSETTAPATRERRSKANSNKAWAALMPAKRGKTSEDEEEQQQPEPAKPVSTPATRGSKRGRGKKESPVPAKQAKKDSPPPPLTPQSEKGEANEETSTAPVKGEDLVPDHDTGMMKLSKMEEGYFEEEEMEEDDDSQDYIDDPNDKDFGMEAMPPPKRGARGKAGAKAAATPARGARGGRGSAPTPQSRAKPAARAVPASPATSSAPAPAAPTLRPITAVSSASGSIVVPRNATTVLSSTGKPLKIVKLNGAAVRGARLVGQRIVTTSSAASLPVGTTAPTTSAVSSFRPVSGGSTDGAVSSMASSASKEVAEITQKYKDRIIPGQTVGEFNKIIDTLKSELVRMAEDRQRMSANHRETIDNMQLHYSTLIDLKESRIRQLEQQVDQLQKKLHTSVDSHLTQVLGNETSTTASKAGEASNGKQPRVAVLSAAGQKGKLGGPVSRAMDFDEDDEDFDGMNAEESYLQESD
ncbi:hypothetical protein QR680_015417 [Steinernema hermaphroditum]|uniref:Uncharacterized protein n=1 Tax=Steinernema hermaphroditum TaxID=289476 RepID=A0AA39H9T0_9BILA|nr:hypothetical protein QR680_015417 [Steinernema hermaphroditum]